jgi:hypothetical protein
MERAMDGGLWIFIVSLLALYFVGLVIWTMANLCGSLACAGLCSIRIGEIHIGSGPIVLRGRLGGALLALHLLPVFGIVAPAALPAPDKRWALALFYGGGILANVAAGAAMIASHAADAAPVFLHDP